MGHGDHAAGFEFLVNAPLAGLGDGGRPAHGPSGPVAGRAERALHAAGLADENPRRPAHVPGDDDRLADFLVYGRQFLVPGREGPRRPFAVDPELLGLPVNGVFFQLGDVVGHVVQEFHAQVFPRLAEHAGEHLARLLHQQLPVAEPVVGGRPHGSDIAPALRALGRGAGELPVGEFDAVLFVRVAELDQGVVAHLIPQPAGAGVDHHADHVFFKAEHAGDFRVDDGIDDLHFHEVIAAAQRAALLAAALDGVRRHVVRHRVLNAAVGLRVGQVPRDAQAAADHVAGPLFQQRAHFFVVEGVCPGAAHTGRDGVEQGGDQLPHVILHVPVEQVRLHEAHAAIDVVADAAGANDAPLGRVGRGDAADAEAVTPVDVRHGDAGDLDARQEGDVGHLVGGLVLLHRLHELLVGEDHPRDAHALLVGGGDADAARVDSLQRAAERLLGHGFAFKCPR